MEEAANISENMQADLQGRLEAEVKRHEQVSYLRAALPLSSAITACKADGIP